MHLQAKGFLLLVGVNIKGGEMRALFIVITLVLGFFILTTGIKIVEDRLKAVAEISQELIER